MPSKAKVKTSIFFMNENILSPEKRFIDWTKTTRSIGETLRFNSILNIIAIDMKPSPPICIRSSITARPNPDQYMPVSTVISPVTQVALVAVKNAVFGGVNSPSADETGSMSKRAPAVITRKKPNISI